MLMTSIFAFGIPPMYLYAVARMGGAFVPCAKFRIALLRLLFLIYCEIKETLLVFSLLNSSQRCWLHLLHVKSLLFTLRCAIGNSVSQHVVQLCCFQDCSSSKSAEPDH